MISSRYLRLSLLVLISCCICAPMLNASRKRQIPEREGSKKFEKCPICHSLITYESKTYPLPGGNSCHLECMQKWVDKSSCAYCRDLLSKSDTFKLSCGHMIGDWCIVEFILYENNPCPTCGKVPTDDDIKRAYPFLIDKIREDKRDRELMGCTIESLLFRHPEHMPILKTMIKEGIDVYTIDDPNRRSLTLFFKEPKKQLKVEALKLLLETGAYAGTDLLPSYSIPRNEVPDFLQAVYDFNKSPDKKKVTFIMKDVLPRRNGTELSKFLIKRAFGIALRNIDSIETSFFFTKLYDKVNLGDIFGVSRNNNIYEFIKQVLARPDNVFYVDKKALEKASLAKKAKQAGKFSDIVVKTKS